MDFGAPPGNPSAAFTQQRQRPRAGYHPSRAAFSQTYNYDQVNRLCTVREVPTATPWGAHSCGDMQGLFGGESWRQTFGYDRFGNE